MESKAPQALAAQLAAGEKALATGQEELANPAFDLASQPSVSSVTSNRKVFGTGTPAPVYDFMPQTIQPNSPLADWPDWLVEVLSPSTARYDRFKKIPVYERAGVREVWLIQPKDRTVSIFLLEDGRYGEPTVSKLKGRTALTAVPGIVIRWKPLVDDLTYG